MILDLIDKDPLLIRYALIEKMISMGCQRVFRKGVLMIPSCQDLTLSRGATSDCLEISYNLMRKQQLSILVVEDDCMLLITSIGCAEEFFEEYELDFNKPVSFMERKITLVILVKYVTARYKKKIIRELEEAWSEGCQTSIIDMTYRQLV